MLKEVHFENWKSFVQAKLPIDPLTVLIGTNASGKSNALDGISFLSRTANGKDFHSSLVGDPTTIGIRGGIEWAALKPNKQFTLSSLVYGDDKTDYLYSITVTTLPQVELSSEVLTRIRYRGHNKSNPSKVNLFWTDSPNQDSPSITARLYNEKAGIKKECRRTHSILSQLNGLTQRQEITDGINIVCKTLQGIFILDPVPRLMRTYSPFSSVLASDASNLSGVLAALPESEKLNVERILSQYVTQLPERDIRRVWAEPVGKFQTDAMLYCEEEWVQGQSTTIIDARGMSDGTLRFLGILTALLTRPKGTQIIIEEVDNGLHPSRSGLLLKILKEIGYERQIDVLVTTHNPSLLDAMGPEMIPFIVVANRNPHTGESKLTLLEDVQNLPKLLASGPLGRVTSQGAIEKSLSGDEGSYG